MIGEGLVPILGILTMGICLRSITRTVILCGFA